MILEDLGGVLAGFRENSWGALGGLGGFWVEAILLAALKHKLRAWSR